MTKRTCVFYSAPESSGRLLPLLLKISWNVWKRTVCRQPNRYSQKVFCGPGFSPRLRDSPVRRGLRLPCTSSSSCANPIPGRNAAKTTLSGTRPAGLPKQSMRLFPQKSDTTSMVYRSLTLKALWDFPALADKRNRWTGKPILKELSRRTETPPPSTTAKGF